MDENLVSGYTSYPQVKKDAINKTCLNQKLTPVDNLTTISRTATNELHYVELKKYMIEENTQYFITDTFQLFMLHVERDTDRIVSRLIQNDKPNTLREAEPIKDRNRNKFKASNGRFKYIIKQSNSTFGTARIKLEALSDKLQNYVVLPWY